MDSFAAFKEKLDKEHKWPSSYMFKFIVPKSKTIEFKEVFVKESFQSKESKAGNYTSFTMNKILNSSDEVVEVYQMAKKIEGLIAL